MKKEDIGKIVVEGLIGMIITTGIELIAKKIKDRNKEASLDNSLVGDLTVWELKQILREEA